MQYKFNTYKLNSGPLSLGQLSGGGGGPSSPDFVFDVTTDNTGTSEDDEFTLPLTSVGTYDFNVDWGDGNDDDIDAWDAAAKTHAFTGGAGTYTITITGTISGFRFNAGGDYRKIIDISNWGDLNLGNQDRQFRLCSNLEISATDSPTVGTTLFECFISCSKIVSVGGVWDLTGCTSIRNMFKSCPLYNDPNIGGWDVSGVTDEFGMISIFFACTAFNQDISAWDMTNTTTIQSIFSGCSAFNGPLNAWDTSNITEFTSIFKDATSFNQDLSDWDMTSALNISSMFKGATAYNQPMVAVGNKWNLAAVTNLSSVFSGATAFNQNINSWDVSACGNFANMFLDATSFNQPVEDWLWFTGGFLAIGSMFEGATSFDQSLDWDFSGVDAAAALFKGATSFNQDISGWDTGNLTTFSEMFSGATSFDQDLGAWDITGISSAFEMFLGVTLSTANYNALLVGWEAQTEPLSINFHGGNSTHSGAGTTARNVFTGSRSWTITDGGAA